MQLDEDTYAVVRSTDASRLLERTAVERNTHDDLAHGRALRLVPLHGSVGRDTSARTPVEVGLVVSLGSDISTCESKSMFADSRR